MGIIIEQAMKLVVKISEEGQHNLHQTNSQRAAVTARCYSGQPARDIKRGRENRSEIITTLEELESFLFFSFYFPSKWMLLL